LIKYNLSTDNARTMGGDHIGTQYIYIDWLSFTAQKQLRSLSDDDDTE